MGSVAFFTCYVKRNENRRECEKGESNGGAGLAKYIQARNFGNRRLRHPTFTSSGWQAGSGSQFGGASAVTGFVP